MRPVRQTLTVTGPGAPIVTDFAAQCNNFDLQVKAGGSTITLQQTLDDPFASTFNPATATWTTIPNGSALAADTVVPVTGNPTCVRANITAFVGNVGITLVPNSQVI